MSPTVYTLTQFLQDYPNDDVCLDRILRDKRPAYCSRCGIVEPKLYRVRGRKCYVCQDCGHHFYPLVGTIFHRSTTPLTIWFYAIYLFSVSKNGVSSLELQRQLGVTRKTAWRIGKQIRMLMTQDSLLLVGIVEADEAYIGGRRSLRNRWRNKTAVLGAVERGGRVHARITDVASASRVTDFLASTVKAGAILQTDESPLYIRAEKLYTRKTVIHSRYEFVRGGDYTNTIEGFWGLLKPSLLGTHRSVSKRYLQLYVNEFVWRYNHRGQQMLPLLLEAASRRAR